MSSTTKYGLELTLAEEQTPCAAQQGICLFCLHDNAQTAWLSLLKERGNKSTGRTRSITGSSTNFLTSLKAYSLK